MKDQSNLLFIGEESVGLGEQKDIFLSVSETYMGTSVRMPVRVIRAKQPGPVVFVTGAVHGDEIVGVGIVHELMSRKLPLKKGTLLLVPVGNVFGFENHSRYLPDRRDLNRCFPGNGRGSLTYRLARILSSEIIQQSDYGIDLHSAAVRRTNFPHVRANLASKKTKALAFAFGCELVIQSLGPKESLRRSAQKMQCSTIVYEAGEALKFEPGPVRIGVRGVINVLKSLGMLSGKPAMPNYQMQLTETRWLRSNEGGLVKFSVGPGAAVSKGKVIAVCRDLLLRHEEIIKAPFDGVVLGMTTLPAVKPGEPICHLAKPSMSLKKVRNKQTISKTLHRDTQDQLATSFLIS